MNDHEPHSLETLSPELRPGQRILGLDLGEKTIGVALSDTTRKVATPFETLTRSRFQKDAGHLLAIAKHENVGAIVLGLPINMDGSEGPRAQSTRAFARNLAMLTSIPIVFWDERLSTAAVERMLIEADRSRMRRDEIVDKLAAAYILQGALDRLSRLERGNKVEVTPGT